MSELPYTFPIRWYGDALDAYAPFADRPGAFSIKIDSRYTLMGWEPRRTFSASGGFVTIDGRTRIDNPAAALQSFVAPVQQLPRDPYHPFHSGLVGYMLPEFNAVPAAAETPTDIPQAWFGVYDPVIVHDQMEQKLTVLSLGLDEALSPSEVSAEERAVQLVQQLVKYNGRATSTERQVTAEASSPLQFMSLDAIQAQCAQATPA